MEDAILTASILSPPIQPVQQADGLKAQMLNNELHQSQLYVRQKPK